MKRVPAPDGPTYRVEMRYGPGWREVHRGADPAPAWLEYLERRADEVQARLWRESSVIRGTVRP